MSVVLATTIAPACRESRTSILEFGSVTAGSLPLAKRPRFGRLQSFFETARERLVDAVASHISGYYRQLN